MKSLHIIASVFLALPSASAGRPMASGTIVVIAQTKSRVIIAADSRVGNTENGTVVQSVDDSFCKIAALSGDVVFAAAGLISDGRQRWTAISEATAAISNTPHGSRISGEESDSVLARWADSMMRNYKEFSSDQLSAYADGNSGHIATGVLVGVENTGHTWIHAVKLNYSKNGSLSYQGYVLTSNDPPTAYYSVGKGDVFREFEEDKKTSRALAERAAWEHIGLRGAAFDEFKVHRLVELTVMYHTNKLDVGGPVDEIELDTEGLRWIHVKQGCQGDIAVKRARRSGS